MNLLIRIARPTDLDAVGSLLAASYSGLLATHYDDDLLGARPGAFLQSETGICLLVVLLCECGAFYQASGFKRVGPIDVPVCPELTFRVA